MKRLLELVGSMILVIVLAVPAQAGTDPRVYPPGTDVEGVSHADWLSRFSPWLLEIPTDVNPYVDPESPENCSPQGSGVIFVGPSGADCSIPEGASIAVATAFWECSTAEGDGESYWKLRKCATRYFARDFGPKSSFHFRITLDGERIRNVRLWTVSTPGEIIDFPEDNVFGVDPGPSKSASKGFMYILRPLDVGAHRLVVEGGDDVFGPFTFIYRFHVEDAYPTR